MLGLVACSVLAVALPAVLSGQAAAAAPLGQIKMFSAGLQNGSQLVDIALGPDGNAWFTDQGYNSDYPAIGRITPAGKITEFSAGLHGGDSVPDAIAGGPDGNVWFTDVGCREVGARTANACPDGRLGAIGRITPTGQITEFSAGLNPNSFPDSITAGPDGNMWFTDDGCDLHLTSDFGGGGGSFICAIGRITPSGQITEFPVFAPTPAGIQVAGTFPTSITSGPDGGLWFTDESCSPELGLGLTAGSSCAIGRITPSGQITEFVVSNDADSITTGPDGNLWFTNGAIGRITPSGQITEFTSGWRPGTSPGPFYPNGEIYPPGFNAIAAGPDGTLWFTNSYCSPSCPLNRITTAGQVTSFSRGLPAHSYPQAIAPGHDGNMWFIDAIPHHPAIGRIGAGSARAVPLNTVITTVAIGSARNSARFRFKATGTTSRFQCGLVRLRVGKRGPAREPKYAACTSPKRYSHLMAGRYVFYVRAVGSGGPDPTPAHRRFTIA